MQYIILIALIVAADQALKLLVVSQVGMLEQVPVINAFSIYTLYRTTA